MILRHVLLIKTATAAALAAADRTLINHPSPPSPHTPAQTRDTPGLSSH